MFKERYDDNFSCQKGIEDKKNQELSLDSKLKFELSVAMLLKNHFHGDWNRLFRLPI